MRSLLIPALLVLVLGLAVVACNKSDAQQQQGAASSAGTTGTTATQPPAAVAGPDGAALYAKGNCAMCHGDDRAGKPLGPALLKLTPNWHAEKLTAYLKDPQGYTATDSRLQGNLGKYSMKMPPAPLSAEETTALAQWLLSE